jgi:hypothetical protein
MLFGCFFLAFLANFRFFHFWLFWLFKKNVFFDFFGSFGIFLDFLEIRGYMTCIVELCRGTKNMLCPHMMGPYTSSVGSDVLFICLSSARQQSVFAYPKQRATVLVGSVLK